MTEFKIKNKILIVDDTPANIQILNSLLSPDYQVLFATNGPDAINMAEREQPDIILLDVMMPDMDGFMVCKVLKSVSVTRSIPVIFVTAMGEEQNESMGLELGAIDYITKPIVPAIAKIRIKNQLELKRQRDLLSKMSTIDGLTHIANRRRFDEHMVREWHRAIRYKSDLSLILIDIDHFKNYNDHYGHLAGDECLKLIAERLSGFLRRPTDLVARFGGEEFICILPQTSLNDTTEIARDMCQTIYSLSVPHKKSDTADYVTISCGVSSLIPECSDKIESFIHFTDSLLYEAKDAGRNQIKSRAMRE